MSTAPLGVTGANGGTAQPALSQSVVARMLVQPLAQASVFLACGVTIIESPGGVPVRVPKQAPPMDPLAFVGENALIPTTDAQFGEVDLLPSTLPSVKILTLFSAEIARQSVISLDAALQQRLVTDVASTIDAAMIAGNGDGVTGIRGLLSFPGVQSVDMAGAALGLDDILNAWGLATGAFVDPRRLRLWMRSETYVGLRKIKSSTGSSQYALGGEDATQAVGPNVLGLPTTITNRIPATGSAGSQKTSVVLWDPSQTAVARDLAPSVKLLDQTFADRDQLALRVVARYDVAPLNPQAIVVLRNVKL